MNYNCIQGENPWQKELGRCPNSLHLSQYLRPHTRIRPSPRGLSQLRCWRRSKNSTGPRSAIFVPQWVLSCSSRSKSLVWKSPHWVFLFFLFLLLFFKFKIWKLKKFQISWNFEKIIKKLYEKIKMVELVHEELERIIQTCLSKELRRFPRLVERLKDAVSGKILSFEDETVHQDMIETN